MTQTSTPATIGSGKVVHAATRDAAGRLSITCGAVHYRSARRGTVTRQPAGTEVTCSRCRTATPAPTAEIAEPLTFMQRQRLAGKAR